MEKPLLFEIEDRLGVITLNRPDHHNSISPDMITLWVEALEEARTNPDVHAIIITGAGPAFCGGGDVNRLGATTSQTPLEVKEGFRQGLHQIPLKLEQIDKPVIAAVNGAAYGAGVDFALHADIRFAAESAKFRVTYALFGLTPGNGGTHFLPRIVGESKALELFWSADLIDAQEALRIGLVNKVFADAALLEETKKWARAVADKAPISVRMIKRSVKQGRHLSLETALDMISSHMSVTRSTYDHAEGIRAYQEKRKPKFEGR
jgi:enoyl-CoA hydratase/carnithine racemase